jgi:hypothetical protein
LFLPWQQNIAGFGSCYTSSRRPTSKKVYPAGGRIEAWHIQEGQFVNAGDVPLH